MIEKIRIVEEHVLSFDELRVMIVDNTYTKQADRKMNIISDLYLDEFFIMYLNDNDMNTIDAIVDFVEDTPLDEILLSIRVTRLKGRLLSFDELASLTNHEDFNYYIACVDSLLDSFIGSIGSLYVVAIEKYLNAWSSALSVTFYDSFDNIPLEHIEYLEELQDSLEEEE